MKKKIIVLIAFIIIIVTSILVFDNDKIKSGITGGDGKQIEFTYTTLGGVPYRWEYEIEDPSIVSFVKSYVIEDNNKDGVVGASVSTNYVFKGLKEGKTTVTFNYIDLTKSDTPVVKSEKHTLRVDSNNNISLIGIE